LAALETKIIFDFINLLQTALFENSTTLFAFKIKVA
jgi:hypothetical protein